MDLAELFEQGGPLMWVILVASIVGVGVFFERLWSTQRARVLPRAFVDRIRALVAKGKTNEALLLCEENGSSIALIMAAALRAYEHSTNRSEIKEAVEAIWNVKVETVRTLGVKGENRRNKYGTFKTAGYRKAFVRLKSGFEIELA